jgi:cellulase
VDKSKLEFFKNSELGWSPEGGPNWGTGRTWATDIMVRDNLTWTVTVPKRVKAGNYVLRFEVIALQMAFAEGQRSILLA